MRTHTQAKSILPAAQRATKQSVATTAVKSENAVDIQTQLENARLGHDASRIPIQTSGVIQRKKTTQPPYLDLARIDYTSFAQSKNTQEEKRDAIWSGLEKVYNDTRAKGKRNWENLQTKIDQFYLNPESLTGELSKKRAEYDQRYAQHYDTKIAGNPGQVQTRGYADKQIKQDQTEPYQNTMDVERGIITADYNYAEKDQAREQDVAKAKAKGYKPIGLPNSEVLWQQYKEVAKQKFYYNKEARAQAVMRNITKVVRSNVQNITAKQVIYMAYPDGKRWEDETRTWQSGSEEYEAMLGVPNVAAAVFMLGDHIDELGGKTIGPIETTADKRIEINYRKLTKPKGKAIEMSEKF